MSLIRKIWLVIGTLRVLTRLLRSSHSVATLRRRPVPPPQFYEHYVYDGESAHVSAAEYIEDVNVDNVVLINGLTKCWRLPGWRVCWYVPPFVLLLSHRREGRSSRPAGPKELD